MKQFVFLACLVCFSGGYGYSQDTVIFQDDFESGKLNHWDQDSNINNPQRLILTDDPDHVFRGKYSVEMIARVGEGTGAKLNKWFMPGYEKVHARWYCKFADDFDQGNHMHFVHLLANRQDNKWSAFGKAGIKPSGDDFYTVGLEPWRNWGQNPAPGEMMFYAYHMDMPIDPKMGKYWGENLRPEKKFIPIRGQWYCMEMMMKANTPGQSDGELAYWIDGEEKGRFDGIRWRSTGDLKINDFWLMLYVHNSTQVNRVWFDDVVISREYIGPVKAESSTDQN